MPIRTLRDLDNEESQNQPNRSAMPNPWGGAPSQQQPQQQGGQNSANSWMSGFFAGGGNRYGDQQAYTASGEPVSSGSGEDDQGDQPLRTPDGYEIQDDMFWSYNLHGMTPQWYHFCCMCCCPCLVGPPCSDVRKRDYKRMLQTFIFWVSIVQLVYFIVELAYGGFGSQTSLGPSTCKLIELGAKQTYLIQAQYQIYRLFVPIFMHAGIFHIAVNLFVQIMIGLGFEKNWKWHRMMTIYFIAGIAGNLLSSVAIPSGSSVGASGAILGIFGAKITNIAYRWKKIHPQQRTQQIITIVIIVFITAIWSFGENVDWASHLGGLVVGMFVGCAVFADEIEDKIIRYTLMSFGILITCMTFLTLSLVLGLVTEGRPTPC